MLRPTAPGCAGRLQVIGSPCIPLWGICSRTRRMIRVISFGRVASGPSGRFLSTLLAVAVFLCHGALGAKHQVASRGTAPAEAHAGASVGASVGGPAWAHDVFSGHGEATQGHLRGQVPGHRGEAPMHSSFYAAALFGVVLLGTAVALLLRGVHPHGPTAKFVTGERGSREPVLPLPRGPTAPRLQAFPS